MNSFDDMDLDDMLNNPFKNIDVDGTTRAAERKKEKGGVAREKKWDIPQRTTLGDEDVDRMRKNHPISDRLLSVEKNTIEMDNKLETMKRIIGEQNERIARFEEELDILRRHLGANGNIEIDDNSIEEQ
ncbi:MAG: hypothetical protein J7M24_04885 [Candidatus Latescibacteria bacterium]|nr:hypothetical protein [Candidatus Latescibacterota bacterium]